MNTIIECPYCRGDIPINRKLADGYEVLEDVYCPHCMRSMDIEFDILSNLPYLLAYFEKDNKLTGIKVKKSEEQEKRRAYQIRYHEKSLDAAINLWYKEQFVDVIDCAECGRYILLNQTREKKEVYGLFCNHCAREKKFRFSYDFLSDFYDTENETVNQEDENQEEKRMKIRSTIIGFVVENEGKYNIYNPQTNQLAKVSADEFESLCLGEFPYRKIRANTLANGEVVETLDGKVYFVADASRNELLDFFTGRIEQSAVVTNLMVNTNCYVKYVPILKKYCTFADVTAGNMDPRIAKMIEVISNDIQTGTENAESSVVAKMVRFLVDPGYSDLLDKETLNDMVMADPQAFLVMSQMTNMKMAESIMSRGGLPISVQQSVEAPTEENLRLQGEGEAEYKQRITNLMEEAVKNCDYEAAAKYQKALKTL